MTLRLIDGFDYFPSGQTETIREALWSAAGLYYSLGTPRNIADVQPGRFGFGNSMGYATDITTGNPEAIRYVSPLLGGVTPTTGFWGTGVYIDSMNTNTFWMSFFDSGAGLDQFTVIFEPYGVIKVVKGSVSSSTVLFTSSAGKWFQNAWFWFEIGSTIDTSAGQITIKVNTVPVWTSTASLNNQSSINNYADSVSWGNVDMGIVDHLYWRLDDMYFCDNAGTVNNTFLGNVRVKTQFASAPGDSTLFTIGGSSPAPTNWQSVLNTLCSDATYVYDNNIGDYDLYQIQSIIGAPAKGIQLRGCYRQDDATQLIARNTYKTGGTVYTGADHYTNQTYTHYKDIIELNPNTTVGWTSSDLNSLQIGPKKQG